MIIHREDILNLLQQQLQLAAAPPLLFLGSGFSQRYCGLPNWQQLLEIFSVVKPFQYYLSAENGNFAKAASLIATDYFNYAWQDPIKADLLKINNIKTKADVLKFFISEHIANNFKDNSFICLYPEELQKLESLNVDAIITTNWDCYLEDIFPEYATYIGQDEIIMANPVGIGEIYKIHGCIKKPDTIILTQEDYDAFDKKYSYLAAKLLTLLIEHPVIFIGYSMQDENITKILESMAHCIGNAVQSKLQNNLIFVQRKGTNRTEGITQTSFKIQDYHIPITNVVTDDFTIIYDAINSVKRKMSAKVLRFIKTELYSIAKSTNPENRLYVANIEELDDHSDIEFVVGIGVQDVQKKSINSNESYAMIPLESILNDILDSKDDESSFEDLESLLSKTIELYLRRSKNTPIFKYLKLMGITDSNKFKDSKYNELSYIKDTYNRELKDFKYSNDTYTRQAKDKTITEIIENNPPQKAALLIAHMDFQNIDIEELCAFLKAYREKLTEDQHVSSYRKLVTIYDRLKFGCEDNWI